MYRGWTQLPPCARGGRIAKLEIQSYLILRIKPGPSLRYGKKFHVEAVKASEFAVLNHG
jgi:hypothetical protein